MKNKRIDLLKSLLQMERPVHSIRIELSRFGWDSDKCLVLLTRENARLVLKRFLAGMVSKRDVEEWANAIEGRDDIGFESKYESILRELVFELANPALNKPLTLSSADEWLSKLDR